MDEKPERQELTMREALLEILAPYPSTDGAAEPAGVPQPPASGAEASRRHPSRPWVARRVLSVTHQAETLLPDARRTEDNRG